MGPYKVYLLLFTGFILLQCGYQSPIFESSCVHHDLYLKILPGEQTLLARDSLKIQYQNPTNEFHFFLNRALSIHQIRVGNQDLKYESIAKTDHLSIFDDSVLYKVQLPPSLYPDTIVIWYEGPYDNLAQTDLRGGPNVIDEQGISLCGDDCWYPRLPHDSITFTLKTHTPKSTHIQTNGILMCSEAGPENDLLTFWSQKEPVTAIEIFPDLVN